MFNKYKRAASEASELNVVPVMNLFMVLIPFLLMGAAFFHIGVIPTSTPQHTPSDSDVPKTPTTVAANCIIEEDAVRLTFSSVSLSPEELDEISAEFPLKGGQYNHAGVQQHLREIKERYPKSTTITVLPYDGLPYQKLVGVLDVLREYQDGFRPDGEPRMRELFPVTVFSKLLIAEETPEGAEESPDEEGGNE